MKPNEWMYNIVFSIFFLFILGIFVSVLFSH
jgi:hypothetical protein